MRCPLSLRTSCCHEETNQFLKFHVMFTNVSCHVFWMDDIESSVVNKDMIFLVEAGIILTPNKL